MRPAVNEINLNASIERLRGSSNSIPLLSRPLDDITEIKRVHYNNDPLSSDIGVVNQS
jgi:hypothetical protein